MRFHAWMGVVCLLAAWPQQDPEYPKKAALTKSDLRKPLLRNYELPDSVKPADKPAARKGAIGSHSLLFIDVDGNGRFDDPGTDGWTLAGQKYMFPLEEGAVLGCDEVSWKISEDAASIRYRQSPLKAKKEYLDTLVLLNDLRMRNGMPPASFDAKLSEGCEKHSLYMDRYGTGHDEEKGKAGYTPEGAEAGIKAACSSQGPAESAQSFYDILFHRLPLFHPEVQAFGIGSGAEHSAIDGRRARKTRAWKWPVLIPAPDSEGFSTSFDSGGEMPLPYPKGMNPGCPITLAFNESGVSKVTAELREGGAKGRPVEILLSAPDQPACREIGDNAQCIGLIPKAKLRARTVYAVRVGYELGGTKAERSWTFTTGTR